MSGFLNYSERNALTGSILAAFFAGYKPPIIVIAILITISRIIDGTGRLALISDVFTII